MDEPEREGYVYLGDVSVDSGMMIVGDPLLLLPGRTDAYKNDAHASFEDVLSAIENKDATGFMDDARGDTFAVALHTGYGDGAYPVFAKRNEHGRIVEVVIDMQMLDFHKRFYGIADDTAE